MESIQTSTDNPPIDWESNYTYFLSGGALAFANKYPSPMSSFIYGLTLELEEKIDSKSFETYEKAFQHYKQGALSGDALCCLRLHELYSSNNNAFGVKFNKELAWLYIVLAQFYAFCSPLGLEAEFSSIFEEFISTVSEDAKFSKSLAIVRNTKESVSEAHRNVISEVLPYFFGVFSSGLESFEAFRKAFDSHQEELDDQVLGAFIMNIFVGDYERDMLIIDNVKVIHYFNNRMIDVFRLYNSTFNVYSETHAMTMTGQAVGVWEYLLCKGKEYRGEIDECLQELLRMCRFMVEHSEKCVVSADALVIFSGILATCYAKGFFVKRDRRRALGYFEKFDEDSLVLTNPVYSLIMVKLRRKLEREDQGLLLLKKLYDRNKEVEKGQGKAGEGRKVEVLTATDCYILGYAEEVLNKDEDMASVYYKKGFEQSVLGYSGPFETLAFKRKCKRGLLKLQREN